MPVRSCTSLSGVALRAVKAGELIALVRRCANGFGEAFWQELDSSGATAAQRAALTSSSSSLSSAPPVPQAAPCIDLAAVENLSALALAIVDLISDNAHEHDRYLLRWAAHTRFRTGVRQPLSVPQHVPRRRARRLGRLHHAHRAGSAGSRRASSPTTASSSQPAAAAAKPAAVQHAKGQFISRGHRDRRRQRRHTAAVAAQALDAGTADEEPHQVEPAVARESPRAAQPHPEPRGAESAAGPDADQ